MEKRQWPCSNPYQLPRSFFSSRTRVSNRQSGFSLIETIISTAIGLIVVLAVAQVIIRAKADAESLQRKADQVDQRALTMRVFLNDESCECNLNPSQNTADAANLRFQIATPGTLTLTSLKTKCGPTGTPIATIGEKSHAGLTTTAIEFKNLKATSIGKEWTGDLVLTYATPNGAQPVKPTSIKVRFEVDDTNPAAAFVSSCVSPDLQRRI